MDLDTYSRDYLRIGDAEFETSRQAYLEEVYANPPAYPNLGRKAKGLEIDHFRTTSEISKEVFRFLDTDATQRLNDRAKAAGATASQMVMAAFCKTICVLGEVDEVILDMVHALRINRQLENFVSNLATSLQLRISASRETPLEEVVAAIIAGKDRVLAGGWAGGILHTPLHHRTFPDGRCDSEQVDSGHRFRADAARCHGGRGIDGHAHDHQPTAAKERADCGLRTNLAQLCCRERWIWHVVHL
jgi:hypothetical protein